MLKAVFHRRSIDFGGQILEPFYGFDISGHAGYGEATSENEGNDIVCAAISSCTMLVCNAVTEKFNASAEVKVEENRISLMLNGYNTAATNLIAALYDHLTTLSENYSNIKVEVE